MLGVRYCVIGVRRYVLGVRCYRVRCGRELLGSRCYVLGDRCSVPSVWRYVLVLCVIRC